MAIDNGCHCHHFNGDNGDFQWRYFYRKLRSNLITYGAIVAIGVIVACRHFHHWWHCHSFSNVITVALGVNVAIRIIAAIGVNPLASSSPLASTLPLVSTSPLASTSPLVLLSPLSYTRETAWFHLEWFRFLLRFLNPIYNGDSSVDSAMVWMAISKSVSPLKSANFYIEMATMAYIVDRQWRQE